MKDKDIIILRRIIPQKFTCRSAKKIKASVKSTRFIVTVFFFSTGSYRTILLKALSIDK